MIGSGQDGADESLSSDCPRGTRLRLSLHAMGPCKYASNNIILARS